MSIGNWLCVVLVAAIISAAVTGGVLFLAMRAEHQHHADEAKPAIPRSDPLANAANEEAFKKMHPATPDAVAALNGQTIDLADGKAYLSLPKGGKAPLPGVLVIHEWWGLNTNVKLWADRLAADGYAALAVDLYGGKTATTPEEAGKLFQGLMDDGANQAKGLFIVKAGLEYLRLDPRIKAAKRATIGWCLGGSWSMIAAKEVPELTAAVIYYGALETDAEVLKKSVHAKLLGVFANKDQWITPQMADEFEAACKTAGLALEIYRYDAEHAFANPSYVPKYDEKNAADAWGHVREFLARHLR